MWASICLLRLIQRLPRNPFFTNNPPTFYLFYLHSASIHLVFLGTSILRAASVPRRSRPIVTGNLMSTSLQGASGPGVHVGIRPAFGQPVVSVNHITPQPTLTWLNQVSGPEQSIIREIKKLIVRLFIGAFGLRTNDSLPGGTNFPPKRYCHSTRYVPVPPMKFPPDRQEGVVCDERKD